jgi:AcrR family transcriptional regulator
MDAEPRAPQDLLHRGRAGRGSTGVEQVLDVIDARLLGRDGDRRDQAHDPAGQGRGHQQPVRREEQHHLVGGQVAGRAHVGEGERLGDVVAGEADPGEAADGAGHPVGPDDVAGADPPAARERFAADGYERATIRAIAADAEIDPAMVMRYFGSKDKLFAAAAEFDLRLPDLAAVPRARLGQALIEHFMRRWEGDEALVALLRAAVTNEAAAERMRAIFADQLIAAVAALLPAGTPADEAARRAGLVATQSLGMALCRYVLRLPPVAAMDRAAVVAWLGPTVQRYLTAETTSPGDQAPLESSSPPRSTRTSPEG